MVEYVQLRCVGSRHAPSQWPGPDACCVLAGALSLLIEGPLYSLRCIPVGRIFVCYRGAQLTYRRNPAAPSNRPVPALSMPFERENECK